MKIKRGNVEVTKMVGESRITTYAGKLILENERQYHFKIIPFHDIFVTLNNLEYFYTILKDCLERVFIQSNDKLASQN